MSIFEKIRQSVDLSSYTSSPFYGDWFALADDFDLPSFIQHIYGGEAQCLLIGNLCIPQKKHVLKNYRISKRTFDQYVRPLLNLAITTYDEKERLTQVEREKIDRFERPVLMEISLSVLTQLFDMIMNVGVGFYGCNFFVWIAEHDALMYFSDEPGIGFIGLSETGENWSKSLVKDVSNNTTYAKAY